MKRFILFIFFFCCLGILGSYAEKMTVFHFSPYVNPFDTLRLRPHEVGEIGYDTSSKKYFISLQHRGNRGDWDITVDVDTKEELVSKFHRLLNYYNNGIPKHLLSVSEDFGKDMDLQNFRFKYSGLSDDIMVVVYSLCYSPSKKKYVYDCSKHPEAFFNASDLPELCDALDAFEAPIEREPMADVADQKRVDTSSAVSDMEKNDSTKTVKDDYSYLKVFDNVYIKGVICIFIGLLIGALISYFYFKNRDTCNEESLIQKSGIIIIFVVVIVLGVVGYFLYRNQLDKNANGTTDTTAINNTKVPTTEDKFSFSGDGATFDAYGHVKSIHIEENSYFEGSFSCDEFDVDLSQEGNYLPSEEMDKIERNGQGQIKHHWWDDGGGDNIKYEYNNDGRVSVYHAVYGLDAGSFRNGDAEDIAFYYNYNGKYISSIDVVFKFSGEGDVVAKEITNPKTLKTRLTVNVDEIDAHGNWIKRSIKGEEIRIEDEGFEYAGEGDAIEGTRSLYYKKRPVNIVQKRTIEYYDE